MAAKKTTKTPAKKAEVTKTPVRNTPLPKVSTPARKADITHDMIAQRAYQIYASGKGGSELDNWQQAERELRGQI